MKIKIRSRVPLITSFEVQSSLNSEIWNGAEMRPEIVARLREIAEEFINNLDLPEMTIIDIILTGSLANYNWSKYSDLDVHIVVDFLSIDENEGLVKKYFDAVRSNWNRKHNIKIKGYDVEIYVQDDDEKHESTGIYSLLHDRWELKPEREAYPINKVAIYKKSRNLIRDIDKAVAFFNRQQYGDTVEMGNNIKSKIKRMRQTGLERSGIFSSENLAFKVLRRSGYMKKLFDVVSDAYDQQKSLAEQE
jgi:predicted nucleotidyltransferase